MAWGGIRNKSLLQTTHIWLDYVVYTIGRFLAFQQRQWIVSKSCLDQARGQFSAVWFDYLTNTAGSIVAIWSRQKKIPEINPTFLSRPQKIINVVSLILISYQREGKNNFTKKNPQITVGFVAEQNAMQKKLPFLSYMHVSIKILSRPNENEIKYFIGAWR